MKVFSELVTVNILFPLDVGFSDGGGGGSGGGDGGVVMVMG